MDDTTRVVPFPIVARPAPTNVPRLTSYERALRQQNADLASRAHQQMRVAAMADLHTDLQRWKQRACHEVDRAFAIEQLEAALRSLR